MTTSNHLASWRGWRLLGFRRRHVLRMPEKEGYASGFNLQEIYFRLGPLDRLRLLLSGNGYIEVATKMDILPKQIESMVGDVSALPPGRPRDGEK